jgi:hypothetical protein
MIVPKKSMVGCYAIGGGLAVLAGFRDIFLPGLLSVQTQSSPHITARYHFAIAIILLLVAWMLALRAKD